MLLHACHLNLITANILWVTTFLLTYRTKDQKQRPEEWEFAAEVNELSLSTYLAKGPGPGAEV